MPNVLIIDSDTKDSGDLSRTLRGKGIDAQVSAGGPEGLKIAQSRKPDVVVLCVELRGVSGYSICNKLKKDAELARIPLILTSSQATTETFEQHKRLKTRAEAYIKKPYALDQLLGLIAQYIDVASDAPTMPADLDDELDVDMGGDLGLDDLSGLLDAGPAPAATPPAARPAPAAPVAAAAPGVSSAELQRAKSEADQLRRELQQTQQKLQQKQQELNDNLMAVGDSSRETQTLRNKIAELQQLNDNTQAELDELRGQLDQMSAERQALTGKLTEVVEKAKTIAGERSQLKARLEQAEQDAQDVKSKAKKAVDIAMQLLEQSGIS